MPINRSIVINARILSASPAGVYRHAREITDRLPLEHVRVAPRIGGRGISGHIWEQTVLPAIVGRRLLWSPANTGPLSVGNQVVTIHDMFALDHPEWFSSAFAGWYSWLIPRLARRVRGIIAVSNYTKERIIEVTGVPAEKVRVIYNGVDRSFRPCDDEMVTERRTKYRIPFDRYFVALSTIEPRKNFKRILKAWANVVDGLPDDVGLVLLGTMGPARVFGDAGIRPTGKRLHMTGWVDDEDLAPLLSGARGLVFASLYEGFGIPAIEAMACGCPVITSDVSALPEVCGDAALYVDPLDTDDISAAIRRISSQDDLRQDLRSRGLRRARDFSWDRSARSVTDLFARLLDEQ